MSSVSLESEKGRDDSVVAISTTSNENALDVPPPPPDGGLTAWLQVLASHLTVFNTWGYISSYGIFQAEYVAALNATPSAISWIGSIQVFLIFFCGTFAGRAMDAGYFRPLIITGLFLQIFGAFMSSLATEYWQLFLSQGLCQGLGDGCMFCPVIALVSTYFLKNRAVAFAFLASGAGVGGMIFPAIAQSLLPKLGFPWTVRVMAFIMMFNAAIILICAKPRIKPRKTGPLVEWSAFKEPPYILFATGAFLAWIGFYWAYFYIRPYSRDILNVSSYTSFSLLLLLNGVGIPGRIIPGIIADRYTGPLNLYILACLSIGAILLCWTAVSSVTGYWIYVAVFGTLAGSIQGLFPTSLTSLTTDLSKAGTRSGMTFTIVSFACLTGPPIAGALVEADNGSYLGAQLFGGFTVLIGATILVTARTAKCGWKLRQRI